MLYPITTYIDINGNHPKHIYIKYSQLILSSICKHILIPYIYSYKTQKNTKRKTVEARKRRQTWRCVYIFHFSKPNQNILLFVSFNCVYIPSLAAAKLDSNYKAKRFRPIKGVQRFDYMIAKLFSYVKPFKSSSSYNVIHNMLLVKLYI